MFLLLLIVSRGRGGGTGPLCAAFEASKRFLSMRIRVVHRKQCRNQNATPSRFRVFLQSPVTFHRRLCRHCSTFNSALLADEDSRRMEKEKGKERARQSPRFPKRKRRVSIETRNNAAFMRRRRIPEMGQRLEMLPRLASSLDAASRYARAIKSSRVSIEHRLALAR